MIILLEQIDAITLSGCTRKFSASFLYPFYCHDFLKALEFPVSGDDSGTLFYCCCCCECIGKGYGIARFNTSGIYHKGEGWRDCPYREKRRYVD